MRHDKSIRPVHVEFLYLDDTVCSRCRRTGARLDAALDKIAGMFKTRGIKVRLRRTHVRTESQAAALGFRISPAIRVNGRDIQPDLKESRCVSCGNLCGCGDVACRVWRYRGKDYTAPPQAMLVEAIRRTALGKTPAGPRSRCLKNVPDNLRRFFARRGKAERVCCTSSGKSCRNAQ